MVEDAGSSDGTVDGSVVEDAGSSDGTVDGSVVEDAGSSDGTIDGSVIEDAGNSDGSVDGSVIEDDGNSDGAADGSVVEDAGNPHEETDSGPAPCTTQCPQGYKLNPNTCDCEHVAPTGNNISCNADYPIVCQCAIGYVSDSIAPFQWNTTTNQWTGECIGAAEPDNSVCNVNGAGTKECSCPQGYEGTIEWGEFDWEGECVETQDPGDIIPPEALRVEDRPGNILPPEESGKLIWEAVDDATGYQITLTPNGNSNLTQSHMVDSVNDSLPTDFTIDGNLDHTSGTVLEVCVAAKVDDDMGDDSCIFVFFADTWEIPDCNVPDQPQLPKLDPGHAYHLPSNWNLGDEEQTWFLALSLKANDPAYSPTNIVTFEHYTVRAEGLSQSPLRAMSRPLPKKPVGHSKQQSKQVTK